MSSDPEDKTLFTTAACVQSHKQGIYQNKVIVKLHLQVVNLLDHILIQITDGLVSFLIILFKVLSGFIEVLDALIELDAAFSDAAFEFFEPIFRFRIIL